MSPRVLKEVSWGCWSITPISSPLLHTLMAETILKDAWVDPAAQLLMANSWCFSAPCINHPPDVHACSHWRPREPGTLIYCLYSTARLARVKGDYCCMTLSHFLFFQRQPYSDKWTSKGEILAAKLQTLVSVIVHSGNIYMTNKKNLWQKNLSCTCLVLSLSSQFYLAFNHIALHLPSSSQSTKIALISLYLITMWDYGFAKLSVKYDRSQLQKIYAQNAYSTWNSTINSRIILKAKALYKMMQKILSDG